MARCQSTTAMIDAIELMGTSEVAAFLGVSRQRVLIIARQPGFPKPLAVLKMGNVWRGRDIRRWAEDRTGNTGPGQSGHPDGTRTPRVDQ